MQAYRGDRGRRHAMCSQPREAWAYFRGEHLRHDLDARLEPPLLGRLGGLAIEHAAKCANRDPTWSSVGSRVEALQPEPRCEKRHQTLLS